MKFDSRNKRNKLTINITPLIDVLFLLVIFVLVTAQFEEAGGITVDLPQGKSKELPEIQTLILSLTTDGKIYLGKKQVKFDKLSVILKKEAKKAQKNVLIVKADRKVPWEKVVMAIDTAKSSGLKQVAFRIRQ
jgi:biopolymer transport protein ExbD